MADDDSGEEGAEEEDQEDVPNRDQVPVLVCRAAKKTFRRAAGAAGSGVHLAPSSHIRWWMAARKPWAAFVHLIGCPHWQVA